MLQISDDSDERKWRSFQHSVRSMDVELYIYVYLKEKLSTY